MSNLPFEADGYAAAQFIRQAIIFGVW